MFKKKFGFKKIFNLPVFLLVLLVLITLATRLAIYLNNSNQIFILEDTWWYLRTARDLPLLNAFRTPGYPALIRSIWEVNKSTIGSEILSSSSADLVLLKKLIKAQLFLDVLTVFLFYLISQIVFKKKTLVFLTAIFIAFNFQVFSFLRVPLPETFTVFLLCLFTFFSIRFLINQRKIDFGFLIISLVFLIFSRPFYLYLPIFIFLFFLGRGILERTRLGFQKIWPLFFILIIPYLLVFLYSKEMKSQHGIRGLSLVSDGALFGKVLQYGLEDRAGPRFEALKEDIKTYRDKGGEPHPWAFVETIGKYQSEDGRTPDFLYLGKFARGVILKSPIEFTFKSMVQFPSVLTAYETRAKIKESGPWVGFLKALREIYKLIQKFQLLFIFSFIYFLILFLASPKTLDFQMIFFVSLLGFYQVTMVSFGAYSEYARLRMPADPLIWLSIICLFWVNLRQRFVKM